MARSLRSARARRESAVNVLVFEFFPFHAQNFPMYEHWLPLLTGEQRLNIRYYAHPDLMRDLAFPEPERLQPIPPSPVWRKRLPSLRLQWFLHERFLRTQVRRHQAAWVVLNTAEPGYSAGLAARLNGVNKLLIAHNPERLGWQRRPDTFVFCMNQYIYRSLRERVALDGYLLSFFPPERFTDTVINAVPVVGVPGGVSFKRRDYALLLDTAKEWGRDSAPGQAVFNIISEVDFKDGRRLWEQVHEAGLARHFRFHHRLTDRAFARQVYECDYLLPLVGNADKSYLREKNSATFSHAARFAKPMLLTAEEAAAWEVPAEACGIYRGAADLRQLLAQVQPGTTAMHAAFRQHVAAMIEANRDLLAERMRGTDG